MSLDPIQQVIAIKANDDKFLKELYLRNFGKVRQYIIQNSGNEDDAKDIFQEAYIALWRNVQTDKFTPQSETSLDGYLYKIAQFKWIDHIRKNHNRQQEFDTIEENLPITNPSEVEFEEEFEIKILHIKSSFLELGKNCKELLSSFYYDKKPLKIIAKESGWTEATVKNNKYRCLQKLREIVRNKTS